MKRLSFVLMLSLAACSREAPPPAAPAAKGPVALFVGDSLTAGYGVDPEEAYPALIGAEWSRRGLSWRVRNAAVSGSTTAGALEAAKWALTDDVKLVFVCIGANDGLRGLKLTATERNIDVLISELQKSGRRVVMAGMKMPPNYGKDYDQGFQVIFQRLSKKHGIPLMPFLLEGVAAVPSLNQQDGMHPNVEGHRVVAKNVLAFLDAQGFPK